MYRLSTLSITILILILAGSVAMAGQYSSSFDKYLSENLQQKYLTAIITMTDQVDLESLQRTLADRGAGRQEWHKTVVKALQAKAAESQADLISVLDNYKSRGMIETYKSLWVTNLIIVTGTRESLDEIVNREDVKQVSPDLKVNLIEPIIGNDSIPSIARVEQGLQAIHADQVWAMGYNGDGRLVCNFDTGVDGYHPALYDRWRGFDARYQDNPEWAWCDPETNTEFPFDSDVHGTHTMGTICGLGEFTGDTIGVAMGAEWISAGVIARRGYTEDILVAFQWAADPDGDPETIWDVPDVISISWGMIASCDESYWTVIDGCEAAGVVVLFSAGNEGPSYQTMRSPADRAATDVSSFSVGAVDHDNVIAYFSSRGPSYCSPDGSEAIKPEIAAPGVNIRSCVPGGGYEETWSGTSMACPHIAGVVALMRQANPNLSSRQVKEILLQTAVDLGLDGVDNSYGSGLVDAYAAVTMALQYLDGWGTVSGVIIDMATGSPIGGARVSVEDRVWDAISRGNGRYSIYVPSDSAWTVRVEHEPTHLPFHGVFTAFSGDTVTQDFVLEGKVGVMLNVSFANPNDVSYRSFYIKGSWDNNGFYNEQWSGDQIEIKDNGVFPDQTANDGRFTAQVLLARDQSHTFNWAVYSENYGGEASRLQAGASFQVLTFDPPAIPVLEVNPSGNYNNWVITIDGDHGLHRDLTRGVNGRASRWVATVNLDSGVTYTFNFKVMHSEVASYGSGGVGGPMLRYSSPISAEHQVMFDDTDDSYFIQVTGTDGPPKFLTATSGHEAEIPLAWFQPAAIESQEMAYDNGVFRHGYGYASYDVYMAEMFAPAMHPLAIDSVMIRVATIGDPDWPWPDPNPDPIGVAIFLEGEDGLPEDSPVFYQEIQGNEAGWMRLDVDELIVTEGNFWVAMRNIPGGYDEALGLDMETDYPANKWARVGGIWGLESHFPGDHMIRAKVLVAEQSVDLAPGPDTRTAVANNTPVFYDSFGQLKFADKAYNPKPSMSVVDRIIRSPQIVLDGPPIILDTEDLLGYNIYRDIAAAPFDRNLRDNASLISGNTYLDRGTGLQGPIHNGVSYFYQASAVYDIGGGRQVEVGPSNQAWGTPYNHPPSIPTGLVGTISGDTAKLYWNSNSEEDISAYRVYRCDYDQYNYHLTGTANAPDTVYSEVVQSGAIYRYRISAVDRGGLESVGYSNYVDIRIGLVPPRKLQASTGQDARVVLNWRRPGISRQAIVMVMAYDSDQAEGPIELIRNFDDVLNVDYYEPNSQDQPTQERLSPYDVILVWGEFELWYAPAAGDALAEYVDNGGKVVLSQFCFKSGYDHILEGRIMDEYSPFSRGYLENRDVEIGVFDHSNPLMLNVHMLTEYYGSVVNVIHGGELAASYIDGVPFIAIDPSHSVIGLNAYIGSYSRYTGDMMQVVENSIEYLCGNWQISPSYYRIYKSESPTGPFVQIAQRPGDSLTYVDYPVPNGVEFYYKITAVYPDNQESNPTNPVVGYGIIGSRPTVNPLSYNITVPRGQYLDTLLTIGNTGGLPMSYKLTLHQQFGFTQGGSGGEGISKSGAQSSYDGGQDDIPIMLSSGGPDAYGYTWDDSNEPDGPDFNFIDISSYGYELENLHWDETRGPYQIDYFEFPFYGNSFSTIYIGSNGFISFSESERGMNPMPLPDTLAPANFITPLWMSYYPPGGGHVYYYSAADSFIILWKDMVDPWSRGPYTFEIILLPDGEIDLQYLAIPDLSYAGTVGIQNYDKTIALQISYGQHSMDPGTVYRIKPGWVTVQSIEGAVDQGTSTTLPVRFSAKYLATGIYTGSIFVDTWDQYHSSPRITIPLTLNVTNSDAVDEGEPGLPAVFALKQNYPNPFNPSTIIQYELPEQGQVRIVIYNILGQAIRTLIDTETKAGYQSVVWDGTNDGGLPVSSGIYFYVLKAGGHSIKKTMTLIR